MSTVINRAKVLLVVTISVGGIVVPNNSKKEVVDIRSSESNKSGGPEADHTLMTVARALHQRISRNPITKYEYDGIHFPEYLQDVPLGGIRQKSGEVNTLAAALLLSCYLNGSPRTPGSNHPELLPLNPYISLLLSHYGRYLPGKGKTRGVYGYAAANNYHNNKPFGAYKIYEEGEL